MNGTGWKITTLGWIVLAVVIGLTIYLMSRCLRKRTCEGQKENL